MEESAESPILYVLVIGFHHKKGCQVEFSFPPLVPGSPNECPVGWKYLPTLALPDGSHNFDEDTVFFHLPSLTNPRRTVFGISCFRQIPVEKIKNRTSDITRGTVQKSVCVLSRIPLYGQIQVKMCLITHAYFEEGDFSKVSILEDTYHHLNAVLTQNDTLQQTFVGLSARDFILQWKHKAVLLFKLLLLEKRVIFYKSPVYPLCSTILTLISLFPEMIEEGLHQSACIRLSRPMSPMPEFTDQDSPVTTPTKTENQIEEAAVTDIANNTSENVNNQNDNKLETNGKCLDPKKSKVEIIENGQEVTEVLDKTNSDSPENFDATNIGEKSSSLRRDISSDTISDTVLNNMTNLAKINVKSCGFPLAVFSKGSLCLPYLSLPYLDLLTDVNVRSYVVGATNVLFKQKRQLYDILVDIDAGRIECQDVNLRKYLHLTTEDLRFADYLLKHVLEEKHDVFLDGVGWEGGDEWIRAQFKVYLLCLMRTSLLQDGSREIDHFNANFVTAWRETHNYKIWLGGVKPGILDVTPGHPFSGQLSVADMKLRLAHTMQNTEGGRKINQAMASTGRAVANTSKVVGGALSQAKGALNSWWNNLMVSPENGLQRPTEVEDTEVPCGVEPLSDFGSTENCTDIPDSINDSVVDSCSKEKNNGVLASGKNSIVSNDKIVNSDIVTSNINGKDAESQNSELNHTKHNPGEIHTV